MTLPDSVFLIEGKKDIDSRFHRIGRRYLESSGPDVNVSFDGHAGVLLLLRVQPDKGLCHSGAT
jgi:hypothetical protein